MVFKNGFQLFVGKVACLPYLFGVGVYLHNLFGGFDKFDGIFKRSADGYNAVICKQNKVIVFQCFRKSVRDVRRCRFTVRNTRDLLAEKNGKRRGTFYTDVLAAVSVCGKYGE